MPSARVQSWLVLAGLAGWGAVVVGLLLAYSELGSATGLWYLAAPLYRVGSVLTLAAGLLVSKRAWKLAFVVSGLSLLVLEL